MKMIILAAVAAATLVAADCSYTKTGGMNVSWTAFKTPMKKGVGGTFTSVAYKGPDKGTSLTEALKGATVTIKTATVDSGNAGRDAKLVSFFFNRMQGQTLSAKIVDLDETMKIVLVHVVMNGKGVNVPMAYTYNEGIFSAKGVLDLGDFDALGALHSINKACYEMHEGKTWQDVDIGFSMKIEGQCG
jgi:hypothetical protein